MFRALATGARAARDHRPPREAARDYVRESTVLGFVGAAGIGIMLYASINSFLWRQVSVMPLAIFAVVIVSEFVSATVRRRIT